MATTTLPPHAIDDLDDLYAFRDRDEVVRFLDTNPFVVPLLIEARPVIARHFGAATPVELELVYEPDQEEEDDADLTELFAIVRTGLSATEARLRLDRFDREWWTSNSERDPSRLQFDVRYR